MISQWLFLKLLSLSYFFAFFSLHPQVLGLFGSKGISPIAFLVEQLKQRKISFFQFPSLFLYRSSDSFLKGIVLLGIGFSLLALAGFVPALFLSLLWILYLAFYVAGYPFLSFQWDALLLEAGFAGIFFAIMTPAPLLLFIWMWILLVRLMLTSGLVKWLSGCPEWRALKALRYHFETQPLPNFGGYIAHHISLLSGKFGAVAVYIIEGPALLLLLGTPEMRLVGGLLQLFFQMLIIFTGNYAFFNLLTIALIVPVFDDKYLQWIPFEVTTHAFSYNLPLEILLSFVGAVMVFLNIAILLRQIMRISIVPKWIQSLGRWGILNTYGLFAVMTTIRDEVVIEGSLDGKEWKEYTFRYKPGALNKWPKQIAPLHPRLDWQMWFIALGGWKSDPWFEAFILRLIEGSDDVLGLLESNPFPGKKLKAIRAKRYRYHFTSLDEWRKTGNFWTRQEIGLFLPEVFI